MKKYICIMAIILAGWCSPAFAQALTPGEGSFVFTGYEPFANRPVEVFYYIPPAAGQTAEKVPVVFIFEGADRGYTYLYEFWKEEAQREGFILLLPHFDLELYPLGDYQEAGVLTPDRTGLQDQSHLTPVLIDKIFEYVRARVPSAAARFMLYGHSAGGQFIQRFMLFHNSPYVEKAMVASPGWYTFPDAEVEFPYGTKDISYIDDEAVNRYLSANIILQLGMGDTIRESYLRKTPEADAQGLNRLERGRAFYAYLQKLAAAKQIPLNWQKIEVPGIGHHSVNMGREAVPFLLGRQPGAVTSRFYPETGNRYNTPTLARDVPIPAITEEVYAWMSNLTDKHPGIAKWESLGTTPKGRNINILRLGSAGDSDKVRVFIQACLHGNEPASTEAACILTDFLLNDAEGRSLLEHIEIAIVPIANPDGYAAGKRASAGGLDLNRDQSKLADPVSRTLKKAFTEWAPDVALDIHEFRPARKEYDDWFGRKVSVYEDVLFLPTGHLNIPAGLRDFSVNVLQKNAGAALGEYGYSNSFYFSPQKRGDRLVLSKGARSPQSSSTAFALSNAVSMFIEIRGIGLGMESFGRRAEVGFIIARNMLQTCADRKGEIRQMIQKAVDETVAGGQDIVVLATSPEVDRRVTFVDLALADTFSVTLPAQDALHSVPELVRKRPVGYILSDTCRRAVENLRILGLTVEKTTSEMTLDVEEYEVTECVRSREVWEGIRTTKVRTVTNRRKVSFPKGSFVVYLNQKNANHAVTLLEPESANGFVNFGVIDAELGKVLPVYRLME